MPQRDSFPSSSCRKKIGLCEKKTSSPWPNFYCEQGQDRVIATAITTVAEYGEDGSKDDHKEEGIMKTVTMAVRTEDREDREDCNNIAKLS